MSEEYDIFRLDDDAELWLEPAKTLEEAKRRVKELSASEPGEYFIFDQRKSEKIMLHTGGSKES